MSQFTDNTILITGGGSGIGRGFAEALHKLGNKVIIAGRTADKLDAVVAANPGMASVVLDVADAGGLNDAVARLTTEYPELNILINNAGIMQREDVVNDPNALAIAESTIETNLLGPIRLTAALLPHLLKHPHHAAVMMVTSGLAFVPRAAFPTYCATKAALHSYALSLRHQLHGSAVSVVEIAPPRVQTTLTGPDQATDPNAQPLDKYIAEVMHIMAHLPRNGEIIVERTKPFRTAEATGQFDAMFARVNA